MSCKCPIKTMHRCFFVAEWKNEMSSRVGKSQQPDILKQKKMGKWWPEVDLRGAFEKLDLSDRVAKGPFLPDHLTIQQKEVFFMDEKSAGV
jgi:hypothetical protein